MAQASMNDRNWDLEADVIVIGSGAAGLPAAIKAVEGGASVIVVEANYDVGGHAI
jgi:urocanate reductase